MSDDPIKDLEDSNLQGLTVNPLPPSEVRRLGDRMRRRNAAFAAVGAAAAIAVIVTPLAVLAGGRDHAEPPVTNPSVTPSESPSRPAAAAIPDDFPIAAGLGEGVEGSDTALLVHRLTYCEQRPLGSVAPLDAISAELSGGETSETRTLLLLDDERAAADAEQALLDAVAACPTEGDTAGGIEHKVIRESADWPGRTIQSTWGGDPYPTARFVHVVRAGPALLLTSSYAGGPADLEQTRAGVAPLVAAMAQFGDRAPEDASPSGPADGSDIPADFPIDVDLRSDLGDGGEIRGPGADVSFGLARIAVCGTTVWPVDVIDRLAVTGTGPEYADSRELVVFPDSDAAVAVMADLRTAVSACPTEPDQTGNLIWKLHNVRLDYDSATFSQTYDFGLGGTVWQFVRVGRAIVAAAYSGEYGPDNIAQGIPDLTQVTSQLTPHMCVFTKAGC